MTKIKVIQTTQTQPISSNFSPIQTTIVHGLRFAGWKVFIADKFGRHWEWGKWTEPYAMSELQFHAKCRAEKKR